MSEHDARWGIPDKTDGERTNRECRSSQPWISDASHERNGIQPSLSQVKILNSFGRVGRVCGDGFAQLPIPRCRYVVCTYTLPRRTTSRQDTYRHCTHFTTLRDPRALRREVWVDEKLTVSLGVALDSYEGRVDPTLQSVIVSRSCPFGSLVPSANETSR